MCSGCPSHTGTSQQQAVYVFFIFIFDASAKLVVFYQISEPQDSFQSRPNVMCGAV